MPGNLTLDPGSERGYGYLVDLAPNVRVYGTTERSGAGLPFALPTESPYFPLPARITDQGRIGSCVGCTVADAKESLDLAEGREVEWSKRYLYLGGRLALNGLTLAHYLAQPSKVRPRMLADTGCMISDVVRFASVEGTPSEALDPYATDDHFADLPTPEAIRQANRNRVLDVENVESSTDAKLALSRGDPVILGFVVPANFDEAGVSGEMSPPGTFLRAGHAVWAVKYDDNHQFPSWGVRGGFLIRNSWGADWGTDHPKFPGLRGHFWMPYKFFDSYHVSDCMAILEV